MRYLLSPKPDMVDPRKRALEALRLYYPAIPLEDDSTPGSPSSGAATPPEDNPCPSQPAAQAAPLERSGGLAAPAPPRLSPTRRSLTDGPVPTLEALAPPAGNGAGAEPGPRSRVRGSNPFACGSTPPTVDADMDLLRRFEESTFSAADPDLARYTTGFSRASSTPIASWNNPISSSDTANINPSHSEQRNTQPNPSTSTTTPSPPLPHITAALRHTPHCPHHHTTRSRQTISLGLKCRCSQLDAFPLPVRRADRRFLRDIYRESALESEASNQSNGNMRESQVPSQNAESGNGNGMRSVAVREGLEATGVERQRAEAGLPLSVFEFDSDDDEEDEEEEDSSEDSSQGKGEVEVESWV